MENDENKFRPIILIVEDDKRLSQINSLALASEGYDVKTAFNLKEARFLVQDADPDVILLDVKLPDGSGFDFCREIRKSSSAQIIFLTSVTESEGELEGLVAGGDDYLRKPYGIDLLRNRVLKAVENKRKAPHSITRGPFTLHVISAQAFAGKQDLLLTNKEFAVFLLLAQNEGKVLSPDYIYDITWEKPLPPDKNPLQMTISRLRSKLEPYNYTIATYRNKGYAFEKL